VVGVAAERSDPKRAVRRDRTRLAPATERGQVNVGNAELTERGFEHLGAELRMPPRSGLRTHVGQGPDASIGEHGEKLLERPGAVTDGPDLHEDQCGRLAA
jgi:hypothetical protein